MAISLDSLKEKLLAITLDYHYHVSQAYEFKGLYKQEDRLHSAFHAGELRKGLHEMFLSSNYCDVTLVTNTTTFKAHKVVLAANSAYFHAMFSSTCSEALQSVVSFRENPYVTSAGLSAVLEYAYMGSVSITQSSVSEILEVARHLLMEDVTKSCESFVQDLTIENVAKQRKGLYGMFLSSNYCDVTLETNTATFKAHKVVLAAKSAYFKAKFLSTCSEALQSVVSFKDNPSVTSTGLSAILEYVYLGSFEISHSTVRDILEVARHLLMEDVTKCCKMFIEDITIKQDNYVGLMETAREYGLKVVEKRIERFLERQEVNLDNCFDMIDFAIVSNSDSVLKNAVNFIPQELHNLMFSKELLDIMDSKILIAVVETDTHGIFTDMDLIDFIVKWVERSPEDRLPVLPDVIKEINLLCFEVDALDKIATLPFFKENEKVKEQISEAKSRLLEVKDKVRRAKDDLYMYVFRTSSSDVKFYCLASESVIIKKGALDIRSRVYDRHISMSDRHSFIAVGNILFLIGELISLANGGIGCPCFSYDPARNVWKEHARLPSDRKKYRLVVSEDEVYAFSGQNRSGVDVFKYNFTQDEWRNETPLPHYFTLLNAAALNGSIYVYGFGIHDNDGCSTAFLKYDSDGPKKKWAVKQTPNNYADRRGRFNIGRLVACRKGLYVITKDSVTQHLYRDDVPALGVQFYDPTSDHWEYSTLYHTFDDFDIKVVLSHMDDIYIIANYTKKFGADRYSGQIVPAVFRFNVPAWKMELMKVVFPYGETDVALVSIPKASIARFFDS